MPTLFTLLKYNLSIAGGLLFFVSLAIEGLVLSSMLGTVLIGFSFALALELAKVTTLIIKPIFQSEASQSHFLTKATIALLRIGLIIISVACSTTYLALHIDRPHLAAVRANDIAEVKDKAATEKADIEKRFQQKKQELEASLLATAQAEKAVLESKYLPAIRDLEARLLHEMDNVVKGVFIGPRYREIERLLDQAEQDYQRQHSDSIKKHQDALTAANERIEQEYRKNIQSIESTSSQALIAIQNSDYADDERASQPFVAAAKRLINSTFDVLISDLTLGLLFSLLLALVGEIALYCVFSQAAELAGPILTTQYAIWQQDTTSAINADNSLNKMREKAKKEDASIAQHRKKFEARLRETVSSAAYAE